LQARVEPDADERNADQAGGAIKFPSRLPRNRRATAQTFSRSAVRKKGNWTGDRVWNISSGGQDAETVHGTQKPVECMRRPMLNNSDPKQAIYDPFLGSGTTLIAAETTERVCLAVELDPHYADVAVRRCQAFTGESATLLADGRPFDAIATERLKDCSGAAPPASNENSTSGT
jgi:hypothetical protein